MLALRKKQTYVVHPVQAHPHNEYVCVTVKWDNISFSVVGAYFAPNPPFDENCLENVASRWTSPFVLTGDFNAHNPLWGSSHANTRGPGQASYIERRCLCFLNDGSPTYLRGTSCSTCLDLEIFSHDLGPYATLFTDVDTHGSDHVPTHIELSCFFILNSRQLVHRTHRLLFAKSMEESCASSPDLCYVSEDSYNSYKKGYTGVQPTLQANDGGRWVRVFTSNTFKLSANIAEPRNWGF